MLGYATLASRSGLGRLTIRLASDVLDGLADYDAIVSLRVSRKVACLGFQRTTVDGIGLLVGDLNAELLWPLLIFCAYSLVVG